MSPLVDAGQLETGAGYLCFNATPLIHFNGAGALDALKGLAPVTYTPEGVIELELKKRPVDNADVIRAPWILWAPPHPDDSALTTQLHRRWGGGDPNKDRGEIEVVASARRYGWTAVMEDEAGRQAARSQGVPSVYIVTLLAAAAAHGLITPTKAWQLHRAVEASRGRFSVLPPDAVNKPVFVEIVQDFQKVYTHRGRPPWPHLLATGLFDDVLLARLKASRP